MRDWSTCDSIHRMGGDSVSQWWKVIFRVAQTLDVERIPYSFDASTSVFVHGIEFDMDDVDVMVQWSDHQAAHTASRGHGPTPIELGTFPRFRLHIDGRMVYILATEEIVDLGKDPERVRIDKDGHTLWTKDIRFYRRHIDGGSPLAVLIDEYLAKHHRGNPAST